MQIQAAVYALRNTRGLPWPRDYKKKKDEDLLDWLQAMFGFQVNSIISKSCSMITKSSWTWGILFALRILTADQIINMQKDSVANQREHLILLLANVHIRQFPKPDQQPKVCFIIHFVRWAKPMYYVFKAYCPLWSTWFLIIKLFFWKRLM